MPATSGNNPKGWATGGSDFTPWANVRVYSGVTWNYAKRVFRCVSPGQWAEVWNNRPVTTTGSASSTTYNSTTVTGTVDPNHFTSTPRFFYKKSTEGTYTAGATLPSITGDGAQATSASLTGLTENTIYNYYLSAVNDAGTSDVPNVNSVTTAYDCRLDANGVPLGPGWGSTTLAAVYSGTCGNRTYQIPTKYTKTGCPDSTVNGTSVSSPDCNSTCFDASAVDCAGCGSATLYTAKAGSNCTSYTSGSCGTWESVGDTTYGWGPFAVSGGTYGHVEFSQWGWYYVVYNPTYGQWQGVYDYGCGGLAAPGNVQRCNVSPNPWRVTGTDTCIYPTAP